MPPLEIRNTKGLNYVKQVNRSHMTIWLDATYLPRLVFIQKRYNQSLSMYQTPC